MTENVMKIIDEENREYWMAGNDLDEARSSFGAGITVTFYRAVPISDKDDRYTNSLPL